MPSDAEIEAALSAADFCTNPNTRKLMRRALEAAEAVREREADEVRKWQICERPDLYDQGKCCRTPDACTLASSGGNSE